MTPTAYIDRLISLSKEKNTTVCVFGDMLRVPGSCESLHEARGMGGSVEMLDAAREEKEDKRIRNGLQDFFVFIRENKDLCRVFLGENGDEAFLQKILLLIKEKCREQWPKTLNISDEEFEYRYSFAASGILGIVRYWLSVDCDQPAEKVALLAERCIMRGVIPHVKA